jgi:hypothetical protein
MAAPIDNQGRRIESHVIELSPACGTAVQFKVEQAAGKGVGAPLETIGRTGPAIDGAPLLRGDGLASGNEQNEKQHRTGCTFHWALHAAVLLRETATKSVQQAEIITEHPPVLSQLIDWMEELPERQKCSGK